jgi:RHS repeat-associated protein
VVEIKYDALGRRIEKKVSNRDGCDDRDEDDNKCEEDDDEIDDAKIIRFYYDGARVIEERNEEDKVKRTYIYGNGIDEVLVMEQGEKGKKQYWYHENALGSITHISDKKGEVVESYKYAAYGKVTIYDGKGKERKKSKVKNRFLFTGRELDSETGLYYYRARYYSSEMGRFISRDPIKSVNLYAYANNNPLNYLDPYGLETKPSGVQDIDAEWWSTFLDTFVTGFSRDLSNLVFLGIPGRLETNLENSASGFESFLIILGTILTAAGDIPTFGYTGSIYDAQVQNGAGLGSIWGGISEHTIALLPWEYWEALTGGHDAFMTAFYILEGTGKIASYYIVASGMHGEYRIYQANVAAEELAGTSSINQGIRLIGNSEMQDIISIGEIGTPESLLWISDARITAGLNSGEAMELLGMPNKPTHYVTFNGASLNYAIRPRIGSPAYGSLSGGLEAQILGPILGYQGPIAVPYGVRPQTLTAVGGWTSVYQGKIRER